MLNTVQVNHHLLDVSHIPLAASSGTQQRQQETADALTTLQTAGPMSAPENRLEAWGSVTLLSSESIDAAHSGAVPSRPASGDGT